MFRRGFGILMLTTLSFFGFRAQAERVNPAAPVRAQAPSKTFEVDKAHSYFSFAASTILFDVPGRFEKYDVQISGDPDTLANAQVRVELDASSVNTDNTTRDNHLRSKDFFSVAEFPKIVFTSNSLKKEGNKILVKGTLEMHGVKKEMTIPFEMIQSKNGAGIMENVYRAEFPIDRKAYGIGADSVAAKISLKDQITVRLLLAGFFQDPSKTGSTVMGAK